MILIILSESRIVCMQLGTMPNMVKLKSTRNGRDRNDSDVVLTFMPVKF